MRVMKMLSVESISKSFDGLAALRDISFSVDEGTALGLIGPNGSGKTTLFNVISGFLSPDSGDIFYQGTSMTRLEPYKRAAFGMGRLFQDVRVFSQLSVMDNLVLANTEKTEDGLLAPFLRPWLLRKSRSEHIDKARRWLDFVGLDAREESLASALSFGQEKLLAIAMILAKESKLLLLDEPVAGLDPKMTGKVLDLIRRMKELGKTVIVIEHALGFVFDVADKVIILRSGRKVYDGQPHDLRNGSPVLSQVY
jgi:branched-chain amino acid transport system ATP-binding protein